MSSLPDWQKLTTAQREGMVRPLAEQGLTCAQIAASFRNTSRSAVVGLLHRLEKKMGKPLKRNHLRHVSSKKAEVAKVPRAPQRRSKAFKKIADGLTEALSKVRQEVTPTAPDLTYIPKAGAFLPIPGTTPIPIFDLPNRMRCRWPVDVAGQELHFACGATTATGHVYCAPHRRLAVRGAQHQGAI